MKSSNRPAIRRQRRDSGQGMTEYIIIVALIAIAAIGIVTVFGQNIRSIFAASTQALTGSTAVTNQAKNGNTGTYYNSKGLDQFGKANQGL